MQDKSKTKEVDWSFLLGTKTETEQLLPSVFYSQEEIKTLLDAYIDSQRNVWAKHITG